MICQEDEELAEPAGAHVERRRGPGQCLDIRVRIGPRRRHPGSMNQTSALTVMLVAAEASGDMLGAGMAQALRRRLPDVRFVGAASIRLAWQR